MNQKYTVNKLARISTILLCIAAWPVYLHAQATLQITSPASLTIVNPGQTLSVSVSASGTFQEIALIGDGPLGVSQILSAPPYQFSLQIPQNLSAGTYQLTAAGMIAPQQIVYSDPVSIDVRPTTPPVRISVEPESIDFQVVGDRIPLIVIGTLSDGSKMDLTRSSANTYTTNNPAVATVAAGVVTAVAPGKCQILVNDMWAVTVTVAPPITITPVPVVLRPLQTQQMYATVRNTANNTAVIWSLRVGDPGVINSTGVYTAPASIPAQTSVQVIGTSVEDPTKSAFATLTLYPAISVTVAPSTATVRSKDSQQLSATVGNTTDQRVVWSLNPAVGTMSTSGLYTAPTSVATTQTVTVTATSVEDPTKSGTSTLTVRK